MIDLRQDVALSVGGIVNQVIQGPPLDLGLAQWAQPVGFSIANGVAQVEEQASLPLNALVDDYKVVVQALPPYQVPLSLVAQVRDSEDGDHDAMVVDFGAMVSLAGIAFPNPARIAGVKAWTGAQFADTFTYSSAPDRPLRGGATFTEIRTERLLVRYVGSVSADDVLERGVAFLTDPPSGLELRIDGGPPVWAHPAAVRAGSDAALSEKAWNSEGKRLVDITAALRALTGDPLAGETPVPFRLTLSARLPCLLTLAGHGAPQLRRIRRVAVAGSQQVAVAFASEGRQTLALPLPAPAPGALRRVAEVRMAAAGSFPPQRTRPPVGPGAALGPSVPGGAPVVLADVVIDPGHAICIRIGTAEGLAELGGLRLPLAVGAAGAELRVTVRNTLSVDPATAVESRTSDPVIREAGDEAWTTFSFRKPWRLDPAALPWLVVTAARGEARLAVAAAGSASAIVDAAELRRGPPGGPWQVLPAPLTQAPPAGVLAARGRLRLIGLAPPPKPIAPLAVALQGSDGVAEVAPTAKGVTVTLVPAAPVPATIPVLEWTAFAPGTLMLSAIDVVTVE